MRLSIVIIDFIKHSYPFIICAFFAGTGLLVLKAKISNFGKAFENEVSQNKLLKRIIIFCAILFIYWGYLAKSAFFTPYNTGVQGDNFCFISGAMNYQNYWSARHVIFPWIAGQLIFVAKKVGFFNPQDHLWRFYAFGFASLPVRIFSVAGLIYVYKLFKLLDFSFTKRLLATMFLAVTFGYWLWGIQPNAIGIALAIECIALYYSLKMIKHKSIVSFFLSPLFILLSLYAHISTMYFVFTLSIFMGIYAVVNVFKRTKSSLIGLMIYLLVLLFMSLIFLSIAPQYFGLNMHKPKLLLERMINQGLNLQPKAALINLLANNFGLTLMNMFGLWGPQKIFDYLLVFIILTVICSLLIYVLFNFVKIITSRNSLDNWILAMLLSVFIFPFMLFLFLKNGEHYYVIVLVPTAIFFLYLIFKGDELSKKYFGVFLIVCLIPVLFLLNGFSTTKVLKGMDFRQAGEFKKFEYLSQKYPKENVHFFETFDRFASSYKIKNGIKVYFFDEPMSVDYAMGQFLTCFSPAFPNINWRYSFSFQDILNSLNRNEGPVIVGPLTYAEIKGELPQGIVVVPLQDKISSLIFYKLN